MDHLASILELYSLQSEIEWKSGLHKKFNDFLLVNNRLFAVVSKIGYKAVIGVAATLTELITQRTKRFYPDIDAQQFAPKIESLWAGAIDPLYLKTFHFGYDYRDGDGVIIPFYPNWHVIIYLIGDYMENSYYTHNYLMNLSMLARHLMPNKKLFDNWFAETMRKTTETFPCLYDYKDLNRNDYEAKYDCSADIPVPREFFFDSEFQYSEDTAKPVLNAFLQSLDYNNNPWLCTPEEMLEKGFQGTPYKVG